MTDRDLIENWERRLDLIDDDVVQSLLVRRYVFREVQEIVERNPRIQKPSIFFDWMASGYVASAVMAVRRHVDPDTDAVSLITLLREIRKRPDLLSRERHVERYREEGGAEFEEVGHREFDRFAGQGGSHVDPRLVRDDITALQRLTGDLERYATKRVAHLDAKGPDRIPTFDELEKAIDLFEDLVKKYRLLIKREGGDVLPVVAYPWKAIFTEPWIPPDAKE